MQIAVRYDKVHPPRRIDVAEAAARAVVALLAAPASAPGGPWNRAVDYWRDGRIRKLVRRARGKRWEEVQDIDGVTVTQDGPAGWGQAAARAFVPGPVRPLPGALAKTQVEGTHFPPGDELPPPPAIRAWDESRVTDSDEEVVIKQNWTEIRRFMWNYVGIVRTTKRLERAQHRIRMLTDEVNDYYGQFRVTPDLIELRNLLQTAELIVNCALHRKESRGLHYTLDYPKTLDKAVDTILIP